MSKANFFSLPCELRNAVYGYLWQSTTDLIIQHGPVELHASSSHPNEHDQAISPFSLVCAERMYTTHSVSGSTRYGFPAWLFTNKQILSEGTAKLNWSCGRVHAIRLPTCPDLPADTHSATPPHQTTRQASRCHPRRKATPRQAMRHHPLERRP
jgi:hypothetical protein